MNEGQTNINDFLKKLTEVDSLKLALNEYAIIGSGPMAVRGLRRADDIDILVRPSLWPSFLSKYTAYDARYIKIGNVEIWGDFINLTPRIDMVIDGADIIYGYPFVTLEDTLSWKKFLNREKDQSDIKLIEKFWG